MCLFCRFLLQVASLLASVYVRLSASALYDVADMPILIPLLLKLQCKVANFQPPILVYFAFFLTEPTLLLPWKAEIAGELVLPQSSTHPMTDGRRCINTPVLSALGGITQEYVVRGVPVSPEGKIPFSRSNS